MHAEHKQQSAVYYYDETFEKHLLENCSYSSVKLDWSKSEQVRRYIDMLASDLWI